MGQNIKKVMDLNHLSIAMVYDCMVFDLRRSAKWGKALVVVVVLHW